MSSVSVKNELKENPEKLSKAYELRSKNLQELLLIKGLGAEVVRALSLIFKLIYRELPPLRDMVTHNFSPFKYAYAIGYCFLFM
ncbi:MAG: DUF763 domain-containing protein [Desulfurococcaceae archaeon TW002]